MDIKAYLSAYDTKERNFESIGNNIILTSGNENTILTSPTNIKENILIQIQSCDNSKLTFGIFNGYNTSHQIVENIEIPAGKINYFKKFNNIFHETEVKWLGNIGTIVFIKHSGVSNTYTPEIKDFYPLTFNQRLNQLIVESPLKGSKRMRHTILVGKSGDLSKKNLNLC